MRLLLVTLFVAVASTNGALPGLGAVTNIANSIGGAVSSVTNLPNIVVNDIIVSSINSIAPAVQTLNGIDSVATQQFVNDLAIPITNIEAIVNSIPTNPENVGNLATDITQVGTIVSNYITTVGSQPGAQPSVQQIADTAVKAGQDLTTALQASGVPVPQEVKDAITNAAAQINNAVANL
ncbi:hypothetical protein DMENIID0001_155290 [Sergentomyia squamirostris]